MIKRLLGAFAALVVLFFTHIGAAYLGQTLGIEKGIDMYHSQCYTIGGIVLDRATGTAVVCQPLTQLPEPELKNFLDKGTKV